MNKRADNGTTPVYFAAQEGRLECLKFLIAQVGRYYNNESIIIIFNTLNIIVGFFRFDHLLS